MDRIQYTTINTPSEVRYISPTVNPPAIAAALSANTGSP